MPYGRGPGRTVGHSVSDNFERTSLGGNWTKILGTAGFDIVNSSDMGPTASTTTIHGATWTANPAIGVDQYAEATVSSDRSADMACQVCVRRRSSDLARYAWYYDNETGSPSPGWNIKYDGVPAEQTRIVAVDNTLSAMVNGDRLRLEVRGTGASVELRGFRNGLLYVTATDTASDRIVTAGPPGLVFRAQNGATVPASGVFEDFAAGTLV